MENNKHTPLTLQDCKDKIAKKLMYSSWHDATASTAINPLVTIKALHDEAAELYASQFTRELSELREENERLKEIISSVVYTVPKDQLPSVLINRIDDHTGELKK